MGYYTQIGLTIVFAVLFNAAAAFEARSSGRSHGLLWASLSVLVSFIVFFKLGGGMLMLLLGQGLLFVAIGAVRAWLDSRARPS